MKTCPRYTRWVSVSSHSGIERVYFSNPVAAVVVRFLPYPTTIIALDSPYSYSYATSGRYRGENTLIARLHILLPFHMVVPEGASFSLLSYEDDGFTLLASLVEGQRRGRDSNPRDP